ncbi:MAG: hypothetical protein J2P47_04295 [Acetobacteraceae bacterium]|nr:hypothetical protein [Acetobacteraceae bacterium]
MRRTALLALFVLLAPGHAHAVDQRDFQVRNAGQLATLCGAKPSEHDAVAAINFCHGFTQAAVDMALTQERDAGKPPSICFPNPAPKRQATLDEFVTWVRAQPDRLPSPPTKAFLNFMTERFPCKGG